MKKAMLAALMFVMRGVATTLALFPLIMVFGSLLSADYGSALGWAGAMIAIFFGAEFIVDRTRIAMGIERNWWGS